MKTTKSLLLLLLLFAAGAVNAQCVWYSTNYLGGGTYSYTAYADSLSTSPVYNWTFDDGGTASGATVQHTFTTNGMHSWCLNFAGSCNTTRCDSDFVDVCRWPVSVTHTEGDSVVTYTVQGAQPGWTYNWEFNGGTPSTSTLASPTITFPGAGYYAADLIITTPQGCAVNAGTTTNVWVIGGTGVCTPWTNVNTGNFGQVYFQAYADSSVGTTYHWYFGDGATSNQQNAQHTYATTGTYVYCMEYTGTNCSGSVCRALQVDVCGASTDITYSIADTTVAFGLNGVPAGSTYSWSFPDGDITTSAASTPAVTFPGVGTYTVSVTATTPGGCVVTNSRAITITADSCNGWVQLQNVNGDYASFVVIADSASGIGGSFVWTFGDGAGAVGQYVQHTYAANGDYTYCVTINGNLCSNTICDIVHIDVCQFNTGIVITGAAATTATFGMTGATSGWMYQWSFTGGTPSTSTSANPVITFPAFGNYTANVTVTTGAGCVKNETLAFALDDNPCGAYTVAHDYRAGKFYFWASLDTLSPQTTYTWDFGDGTTATGNYLYHTYQASGTYTYCINYSGPNGCYGSVCDTVEVDICNFGAFVYSVAAGNDYTFTVNGDSMNLWTYAWDFGAGVPSTSTAAHPTVTFSTPGSHAVSVTYTTHNGCTNTLTYTANVPNQGFNLCDTSFYAHVLGNTMYLYPLDTLSTLSTYSWTFGDGHTSTDMLPVHNYAGLGNYQVCMTVTGPGCTASNCHTVVVSNTGNHYITGVINKNGSGSVCHGVVYLVKDSAGLLSAIDTFTLAPDSGMCNGYYFFNNLPGGTYYLKGALLPADADYATYLPTYSWQELNWADAYPITVVGNGNAPGTEIRLTPGNNPGGPGFVAGWVTQGAGLAIGGGDNSHRGAGDPIAGLQLNLLNGAGTPVAYTYSDGSGQFNFGNLAMGTYKLYAEAVGKVPVQLNFTLTQNNPSITNIQVEVGRDSAVTTGVEDLEGIFVDGLMPNPTTGVATLAISVKQPAAAKLSVTDLTGRLVQAQQLQLAAGANTLAVDLSNQSAGVFYVSITGKNNSRVLKLVKTQ